MARKLLATVLTCITIASTDVRAEEARVVLWNGEELFDEAAADARADDLQEFAETTEPDILLLDELCSHEVALKTRDLMGLEGFHVVCSDFNQRDDQQHGSFEVAIISRFPITHAVERDQSPDNRPYAPEELPEIDLLTPFKLGLKPAIVSRGFLWVRIDELKLTICLTHLKSSRSGPEWQNARKRETGAAMMAASVAQDRRQLPEFTCLVAGDLNVGYTDQSKNGRNLFEDSSETGDGLDGYDDTHFLLEGGAVEGMRMKCLVKDIGETYDDPQFAGSGPIDCLYVTGPNEDGFSEAEKTSETFGSDHFSVITVFRP